ncbi:hypothetical protein NFI96_022513 [Prochilodus magdalenae]|nr:hypothetical protein NFI96_022513 [Prochilodus magdalenae]
MFGDLFEQEGDGLGDSGVSAGERSGGSKEREPPPPRGPVRLSGIRNQGGTCYLNALLQTLLFTPEFRGLLIAQLRNPGVGNCTGPAPTRPVLPRLALPRLARPALTRLPCPDSPRPALPRLAPSCPAPTRPVLPCPDSPCPDSPCPAPTRPSCPDSPVQQLFSLEPKELGVTGEGKGDTEVRVIPLELQRLFARLLLLDEQTASTAALTDSFGWTNHEVQQSGPRCSSCSY